MPLNELLKSMENHGEVNLKIAEHELSKSDTGSFSVEPLGNVCFALEKSKAQRCQESQGQSNIIHYI